ncbi:hypothetical protein JHK85_013588 [Glycine max]|nr:hypothetical protein JHK85_013588 [Glycine max]
MKNKGKQVQLMDSSHSDSPKNLSESRCPPYTKKRLIPDSTVISTRHASLRSAKKLIETRGTSVDVAQMKKASEDENPVANHSVQMEEHNAFEAQFIPFEQEHLEEDIEASNSGESSDKNNDKSISMVGHPSFCLNLLNLLIWGTMRNKEVIEFVEKELECCEAEKKSLEAKIQSFQSLVDRICNRETTCKKILTRAQDESARISQLITKWSLLIALWRMA